jgi:integrase
MRLAEKRKWIDDNPATELKAPKVPNKPTMPFTREEMIRIFAALEPYGKSAGIRNAQRLRAFVLLLRYSGLRIGDATQLEVGRLHGNKVLLHTQKTGVPVYCVLPDVVIAALDAAPRSSERYFFWTGASTVHVITRRGRVHAKSKSRPTNCQSSIQCPAHHFAREPIEDHR